MRIWVSGGQDICFSHRLYKGNRWNFWVWKNEAPWTCILFDDPQGATHLVSKDLFDFMSAYEKITQLLIWIMTSVNSFLMRLWSQPLVWSLPCYHDVSKGFLADPVRISSPAPPSNPDMVTSGSKKTRRQMVKMLNVRLQKGISHNSGWHYVHFTYSMASTLKCISG